MLRSRLCTVRTRRGTVNVTGFSRISSIGRFQSTTPAAPPAPKRISRFRWTSIAIGTVVVGGIGIDLVDHTFWKRISRPVLFWQEMFPIYLQYKYTKWKTADQPPEEVARIYEELHKRHAPEVLGVILRLRGLYIKIGQVGATREDIFPKIYRDHFKVLLDKVPALTGVEARQIVETAMGKPVDEVFSEFQEKALGAASIGQGIEYMADVDVMYFHSTQGAFAFKRQTRGGQSQVSRFVPTLQGGSYNHKAVRPDGPARASDRFG